MTLTAWDYQEVSQQWPERRGSMSLTPGEVCFIYDLSYLRKIQACRKCSTKRLIQLSAATHLVQNHLDVNFCLTKHLCFPQDTMLNPSTRPPCCLKENFPLWGSACNVSAAWYVQPWQTYTSVNTYKRPDLSEALPETPWQNELPLLFRGAFSQPHTEASSTVRMVISPVLEQSLAHRITIRGR